MALHRGQQLGDVRRRHRRGRMRAAGGVPGLCGHHDRRQGGRSATAPVPTRHEDDAAAEVHRRHEDDARTGRRDRRRAHLRRTDALHGRACHRHHRPSGRPLRHGRHLPVPLPRPARETADALEPAPEERDQAVVAVVQSGNGAPHRPARPTATHQKTVANPHRYEFIRVECHQQLPTIDQRVPTPDNLNYELFLRDGDSRVAKTLKPRTEKEHSIMFKCDIYYVVFIGILLIYHYGHFGFLCSWNHECVQMKEFNSEARGRGENEDVWFQLLFVLVN